MTDYLSRHPIVNTDESAAENNLSGQNEAESEEEFVINQVHGLFDFIQTNGSIKRFTERTKPRQKIDQSQHGMCKREQNRQTHLLKTSIPLNGVNQITSVNSSNRLAKPSNMDEVNGIDMHFIFKKRGHSPDTLKLWTERKKLLKPEKMRIVGKGTDNERLQEYRPSQQVRKRIVELNVQIYNRFFNFCETLGTTPMKEFQQKNYESWITQSSDTESQTSNVRQEKCPTNAIKKFRKHETNLIRLKQTVKTNILDDEHNERTEETIKKAEKDFALDLPMLVEETARDTKILNAITAVEKNQIEEIFYPYRPHRHHLTTRFGLLFYNDKIVIPEAMRSTIIAMLHQGHPSATKMDQSSAAFWWPGLYREIKEKAENCPSCRSSGKNLTTQLPSTEKNHLETLSEPNQEIQLDFAGPIKSKTRGDVYILVAVDRFSKWPTAKICKNTDTRTVLKVLTEYCSDNGTPQSVRTDNGSCFKSNEFKEFCNQENKKRIRCTPNLHTGTGQVERTIRTIKSLTRANMADGLTFEEGVKLAIETIRQTPHSKLNMTPFQMHYGRKPRTAITNLIGRPECLLSNWKKTLTNYVSAQPTELQMFTIIDSEGEMADYLILNDSKKRNRSVSKEFKQYQFFEKENKPNAMKCRFKTNKILTAANETKNTITTSDGKIIHKKIASKPIKFQLPKKPEEETNKSLCQMRKI